MATTSEKPREAAQDRPGAPPAPVVDQSAARAAAARLVASWLRGRAFPLSPHPDALLPEATDLFHRLVRAGYVLWFVGDCQTCAEQPGLCDVHG